MNIVIIGATSGIGRTLFKKYATNSNRIGIVGRRTHLIDELQKEHPDTTVTATADITKENEIAQTIDALHSELKHVDLAIVCSGTGDINASLNYAVERPTIDTNITGWTFVMDRLYNIFVQQGHGHLVAITSAGGLRGETMAPAYSASKAYQINYMEALRKKEVKKSTVKNNFLSKSLVDSIKSTTFASTRTRQASSQCLNRRVVLFSYDTLFKNLHIARPVDGIATVARSPRRERHTDGELPPPHRLLQIQCIPLSPPDHTKGESCIQARSRVQSGSGHVPFRQASTTADVVRQCAAPARRASHVLGQFQIALHVIGKVGGAHRRLLRFGYFPHLALRHFLVKLI